MTKFDQPLLAELKPSRILLLALGAVYALVAAVWLWVPLSCLSRLALFGLLGGHFVFLYRLHVKPLLRCAVQALRWDSVQGWRLRCPGGEWFPAQLRTPAFLSYRLVAVRFRVGRFRTRTVVVVADRLDENDFRRLRVRLIQSATDRY
ncbi:MAG: protein YgfX [Pseudomonadota bacterium]|nr:protein YgfX [Pseudomonadota bacterium]